LNSNFGLHLRIVASYLVLNKALNQTEVQYNSDTKCKSSILILLKIAIGPFVGLVFWPLLRGP